MADKVRTIPPQARSTGRQYAQVPNSDRYVETVDTRLGNEITVDGKKYRPVLPGLARSHSVDIGSLSQVILALSASTFTAGAASGTKIGDITNVPAGATPVWTPALPADAGKAVAASNGSGGWQLNVAAGSSVATTIAGTITAAGAVPLAVVLTVSASAARVMKAGAFGTNLHNTRDGTGAAQWSSSARDPYYLPYDVKAGDILELMLPMWTLDPVSTTITERELQDTYQFSVNLEYPYSAAITRTAGVVYKALTPDGNQIYTFTPGQADTMAIFRVPAPADIPALTAIGFEVLQDWMPGQTGSTGTNKLILRPDNSANGSGRFGSYRNATTSLITANASAPLTSGYTADNGLTKTMGVGVLKALAPANFRSVLVNGNSIEQGSNEGGDISTGYGNLSGDQYRNRGWATRLCRMKSNLLPNQMSRGSDRDNYRLVAGNYTRRQAAIAYIAPDKTIDMNPHNEAGLSVAGIKTWAAATAYALDDVFVNPTTLEAFLCNSPGTSGSTIPSGKTSNIADGSNGLAWSYIGQNDLSNTQWIAWVSQRSKRLRLDRASAPASQLFAATCPPDLSADANKLVTATAYSYDSTSGNLVVTVPDASKLSVTGLVRLQGLAPSGLNSSGTVNVAITAVDKTANTFTVVRPTGLAAPTGTLQVNCTWADPIYQFPGGNYSANTGFRSGVNRFLRSPQAAVLGYVGTLDIGRWSEAGNPTTPATETAKWFPLLDANGVSRGSSITNDGTHMTSWGNDYIASQCVANDNAAMAALVA